MVYSNYSQITICVLASGSKGNSIFLSDGKTSLLFDAGLSGKGIERRLASRALSTSSLEAIIVSHEHMDHIRGVGVLSRRFKLPVYINEKTFWAAKKYLGSLHHMYHFEYGNSFSIGGFKIQAFPISHDAIDPSGFTVRYGNKKIGIATDMGVATSMVKTYLRDCHLLILEANHDPELLLNGPYPWPLKQRIKGRHGHLSNEEFKSLLNEIKHNKLKYLILAHLSEENNLPHLAMREAEEVLSEFSTQIYLSSQYESTELIGLISDD